MNLKDELKRKNDFEPYIPIKTCSYDHLTRTLKTICKHPKDLHFPDDETCDQPLTVAEMRRK
jgi:hypothetical protein